MEITKYERNGLELAQNTQTQITGLTEIEKRIIFDNSERINKMSDIDILGFSKNIYRDLIIDLGLKSEISKEEYLATVVKINEKIAQFGGLTTNEVKIAIEEALNGKYLTNGETRVFFSPSQLGIWLKSYIEQTKREAMKKKLIMQQKAEKEAYEKKAEPSVQQQTDALMLLAAEHRDELAKNPNYDFGGFPCGGLYAQLENLGIFSYDRETKEVLIDKAKEQIELDQQKAFKERIIKKFYEPSREQIKAKAKHIAWCWWVLNEFEG